jgi:hypothetical protein
MLLCWMINFVFFFLLGWEVWHAEQLCPLLHLWVLSGGTEKWPLSSGEIWIVQLQKVGVSGI